MDKKGERSEVKVIGPRVFLRLQFPCKRGAEKKSLAE
jgi:hypothetical protein